MAKLTLSDLASLTNQTTAITTINSNSAAIETAMENTLSRDGTSPNTMGADLDMDSNRLLNLPEPNNDQEPATKGYVDAFVENGTLLFDSAFEFDTIGDSQENDPLEPPFQITPIDVRIGTAGSYSDSSSTSSNIFHLASWVTNDGSRPTTAIFGEAIGTGASSNVWGGNFVGYANAVGATAHGVEIDYGNLVAGGNALGLAVNVAGGQATSVGIQMTSLSTSSTMGTAIRFYYSSLIGQQPFTTALIDTAGGVTVPYGIDLSAATISTAAFKSNGFSVDGSGNVNAVASFIPIMLGGASASSTLSLRSTSGVGTTDAILFQVGNNGATEAGRINNNGSWTIGKAGTLRGNILFAGNTSGTTTLQAASTASGTLTLPAATDTLATLTGTETFSNKTLHTITAISIGSSDTSTYPFRIDQNTNGQRFVALTNSSTGTSASIGFRVINDASKYFDFIINSSTAGSFPSIAQISTASATPFALSIGGALSLYVDAAANVVLNSAAIATNATDGFLYVPSCAGTPTGTPTAYTGRVPIVVNTTNNKLYFYSSGAWRDAGP